MSFWASQEETKRELQSETGLTSTQINNWRVPEVITPGVNFRAVIHGAIRIIYVVFAVPPAPKL